MVNRRLLSFLQCQEQQIHWWKFRTICIRRIRRVPTRLLISWKQNINSILMSFLQPRNINRKVLKLSNPTSTTSAPILKTFSLCSKRKWFWHRESLFLRLWSTSTCRNAVWSPCCFRLWNSCVLIRTQNRTPYILRINCVLNWIFIRIRKSTLRKVSSAAMLTVR